MHKTCRYYLRGLFRTHESRRLQTERTGVNPQRREAIQIPAKNVAKFVPGKSLREGVK